MKKILLCTISAALSMPLMAQDAYDAANIATLDLNGTARYVGMGGALDALGADISTISTNPAGMGLFRHSDVRFTLGLVSQQDAKSVSGAKPTNMSFDQAGFVWSNRTGSSSYLNFAFNYHKSRNFNHIIAASNAFAPTKTFTDKDGFIGSGQNVQTAIKAFNGYFNKDNEDQDGVNYYESQIDNTYYNLLTFEDASKNVSYYPLTATDFTLNKGQKGYMSNFDFSLSGNANNRVFWGFTFGIHGVHYESFTDYRENLEAGQTLPNGVSPTVAGMTDERSIKGTGFDVKGGVIVRPIEDSSFRFGLSLASPTWYSLTTSNYLTAYVDEKRNSSESYKFRYTTPWNVGVSLGHTIEDFLALGLCYDYSFFTSADMRYIISSGYTGNESRSDAAMNDEIGQCFRGTHTLKVGAELRPDPAFAIRVGYNFVSSPFRSNDDAYRNQKVYSPGVYYASSTDYVNWKPTHRITAGLGTKINKFSIDFAYQYQVTKGDLFPFADGEYFEDTKNNIYIENVTPATSITFARHQAQLTLGYTF